jgi:hypothetical protein
MVKGAVVNDFDGAPLDPCHEELLGSAFVRFYQSKAPRSLGSFKGKNDMTIRSSTSVSLGAALLLGAQH